MTIFVWWSWELKLRNSVQISALAAGGWINKKMPSYQYRKSHCGDKTILRPSYLHNGISYTVKMASLYWVGAQDTTVNISVSLHFWHKIIRNKFNLVFHQYAVDLQNKNAINVTSFNGFNSVCATLDVINRLGWHDLFTESMPYLSTTHLTSIASRLFITNNICLTHYHWQHSGMIQLVSWCHTT